MKTRLFDIENWREIGVTLSRNKTRTFLTAFGIFWGTAMLTLLLGGASGLKGMMSRNFEGVATNMGGCFPNRTTMSYKGYNKGTQWSLTDNDIDFVRRSATALDLSTSIINIGSTVKYKTQSSVAQNLGVEADYFKISVPIIHSGRVINETDVQQSKKIAAIGKNVADNLFGDEDPIGKYITVNNVYFKIVGVVSQTSEISLGGRLDDAIVLPSTTLRRLYNLNNNIGFFLFTAKPGHSPKEIEPWIRRAATMNHPINPEDKEALFFMDVSENFEMVDNLFLGLNLLALFVGIGTLLAGVVGVGNIMWIIVKERTTEIGIRRAIGAKPKDIITQILSESMVLTSISGLAGISFATLILYIVDKFTTDPNLGSAHFEITFYGAITIMIVFMALGTVAGLVPALKAMRIKPVEALNDK